MYIHALVTPTAGLTAESHIHQRRAHLKPRTEQTQFTGGDNMPTPPFALALALVLVLFAAPGSNAQTVCTANRFLVVATNTCTNCPASSTSPAGSVGIASCICSSNRYLTII